MLFSKLLPGSLTANFPLTIYLCPPKGKERVFLSHHFSWANCEFSGSCTWNPKQPFINRCLVKQPFPMQRLGIIQLKQPFINGCLGFQVPTIWLGSPCSFREDMGPDFSTHSFFRGRTCELLNFGGVYNLGVAPHSNSGK